MGHLFKVFPMYQFNYFFIAVWLSFSSAGVAQTDLNSDAKPIADLIIQNGRIYTVNEEQPTADFIAVKGDRIIYVGNQRDKIVTNENTLVIDLEGNTLTPGFIEGHGHLYALGVQDNTLDLSETESFEDLVSIIKEEVTKSNAGDWIIGTGWHQSKWTNLPEDAVKGFPTHFELSEVSPDNPVLLVHTSGHLAMVNSKAMEMSGLGKETVADLVREKLKDKGEVILDDNGNPTGILNENAMDLITVDSPEESEEDVESILKRAQGIALKNGITGFHDAGTYREDIKTLLEMKRKGELDLRMYLMIAAKDKTFLEKWFERGPQIDHDSHWIDIRAIKVVCDGALGSRGAWLLEPYSDRPGHFGHATISIDLFKEISREALENGFQVAAHAIGDRANREVLNVYEEVFENHPEQSKNHRFRIEHAQHLHPEDIDRFAELDVLPSMQGVHLASDRPWAIERLGGKRIKEGAYVWQKLIDSGARIINGTDVPVEPIDPLANFYASVSRKTLEGTPKGGFEPEQKMTRLQALKSYTINPAYGSFMEDDKGSIEVGKLADFTVFDKDIMKIPEDEILETNIEMTIVGGEIKYKKENR